MKLWLLLSILPFLLEAKTTWQADLQKPFIITITIDPQQITLGDSLNLQAEFHYPSFYQLDSHALIDQLTWSADPLVPQWSLLQSQISSLSSEEGVQAQRLSIKLAPLTAGQLELSFLTITFLPKEATQSPLNISTPLFSLDILQPPSTVSPPFAPLIPLEPQFPLELTQANRELLMDNSQQLEQAKELIRRNLETHSFPWITLVTLLGCGGVGWTIYLTRDRWPKRSTQPIAALSPKQQIDQAIQTLQNRHFDQEHSQAYYADLASLLLDALQAQLRGKIQKFTTVELAQAMKKQSLLSPLQIEEALSLLTEIDQVKFAGKKPSQTEAIQMSQHIQEFIKKLV